MIYAIDWFGFPVASRLARLSPEGHTTIRAPSGAGKSTSIRMACIGLLGVEPDGSAPAIPQGARIRVALGPRHGIAVTRPTVKGRPVWETRRATGTPGQDEVAAYTPPTGHDADVRRLVLVPHAWQTYGPATDTGRRALRTLLATVAGVGSDRDLVIQALPEGVTLGERESHTETAWREAVREAGRAADAAEHAVEAQRAILADLEAAPPVTLPAPDDVEAAREVLAVAGEWARYDAAAGRHAQEAAARPTWGPEDDAGLEAAPEAVEAARAALRQALDVQATAQGEADRLAAARSEMRRRYDAGQRAAGQLNSVPCHGRTLAGVDCGACPLIADARAAVDAAPTLEDGRAAAAAVEAARAAVPSPDVVARARAVVDATQADLSALRARRTAYLQSSPIPAPTPPATARPEPDVVDDARATIDAVEAARAELAARDRRRAHAEQAIVRLTPDVERTRATHDRARTILAAVLTGPALAADRLREAYGAPLERAGHALHLGTGASVRDLAVDVLPMGRPWATASTGERIHADAVLRAALREAAGLKVPIFVDEAQSCTIPLGIPGPVVSLVTAADARWEVMT